MRILIVRPYPEKINIDSYNVQEIGLAKAIVNKGHECGIVFFDNSAKSYVQKIALENGKEIIIYWQNGVNIIKNGWLSGLNSIIDHYDIIQVHEYDQLYSWYMYSFSKKPVVVYHGPYYDSFNKKYNLKTSVFDKIFLNRSNMNKARILTKSKLAEQYLREKGFKNVQTVGVGLDESKLVQTEMNDTVKDVLDKVAGTESFLYVGKIEERRNILFLLDVFSHVVKQNECKLILVGNGQEAYKNKVKEKISALNLDDSIIWIEKLKQDQLSNLYKNCKYFLFPTNYDIFGMVLLEAMYYGMTVFSSKNGGSSTLIKDGFNGIEIESFDKDLWIKRITEVLENEDRQTMGLNASNTIKNEFLWSALADNFIEFYQKSLEGRM